MSKEKKNSLLYVKIFILAVILLVLVAIVFRLVNQYSERSFTENTYNLLIISNKYIGVVGLDDNEDRLSAALVTRELENIKRENIMLQSVNFGVPIHGYVVFPESKDPPVPTQDFFSISNIQSILLDSSIKKKNITFFDWMRLHFVSNEVEEDRVKINSYATINDLNALIDKENDSYFRNSNLSNRKTSLQIINATGINGIANRVGDMYSRTGFNVVSVTSEEGLDDSQIVYSDEEYIKDAELIKKSFDFTVQKNSDYQVADITLIIGEESELILENLAR